jgi:hypothetical protein
MINYTILYGETVCLDALPHFDFGCLRKNEEVMIKQKFDIQKLGEFHISRNERNNVSS